MSQKIKCLIVDDEPLGREVLENFVNRTPFLELVGSFGQPFEALDFIQHNKVDLLLTDIEMPQLNGLQLINSLSSKPLVIFITAFREYALDGFDSGIVDYLVKPASYDRFLKAINRAKDLLRIEKESSSEKLLENVIFIKADSRLIKIKLDEVIYIEALKDYLRIHLSQSERYVTYSTMKAIEDKLPNNFFRIQRSFIINTKYIKSFHGNTVKLTIGEDLPVSASVKNSLFQKLGMIEK